MVSTIIHNKTEDELSVKGGNAGMYRQITKLPAREQCTIEDKPSATYRDYVVVKVEDGPKVFISPEEVQQFEYISVTKNKDGGYEIEGRERSSSTGVWKFLKNLLHLA